MIHSAQVLSHPQSNSSCHSVAVTVQVAGFLGSLMVIGITWYRTIGTFLEARKVDIHPTLVHLLLRDGASRRKLPGSFVYDHP